MGEAEIAALLASGDLERVEADPVTAGREIAAATRHVESASRLAEDDPSAGFSIGYDAVRKAITAHMRARGLRVRTSGGHHRRIGRYAVAALDGEDIAMHVEAFDQLRRLRNQSQYDGLEVEPSEVREIVVHARAIVAAVSEDLAR